MKSQPSNTRLNSGDILITVLVFAAIAVTITAGLTNWGAALLANIRNVAEREQVFQIAEAGIDYYRWHLAHAPSDFTDGTGGSGPYVHEFRDKSGVVVGEYSLEITPPPPSSTIVKVRSTGALASNPAISRTIEVVLAIPSLARFAVVANDVMYFGAGTEVFGPVHSNYGVHFDGVAHNLVTSATESYKDPDRPDKGMQFGVYTNMSPADPHPPSPVPNRPDVFVAGRQFPVPAVDISGLVAGLSQLKLLAQEDGLYYSESEHDGRSAQGYHLKLKTDETFDIYVVTSQTKANGSCSYKGKGQAQWGTWSIEREEFVGNYDFPDNGIIFLEDDTWIDGQIDGARLTIATGRFPESKGNYENIIVNNDLTYAEHDGSSALGLGAHGDVSVGLDGANIIKIDGALVAENGRVGRNYYDEVCGTGSDRESISLFGMIATNKRYGFAYTDGTGYRNRDIVYDNHLLYNPPPGFPLVSNQYQTVSWKEVN